MRERYICSVCGAQTPQWLGQCPGCHEWNTLKPARQGGGTRASANMAMTLADVPLDAHASYSCGMEALDRILGDGLHPGASILMGGEPGIGKSTLILQLAAHVAAAGQSVLYASGEEGLPQIRARAQRIGSLARNLSALSSSRLEDVLAALEAEAPALLVLDSAQTFASSEAEGLPGNVSQVRAVATTLIEKCRELHTTLVIIGHVTKDGAIAGPRLLEHMVDTVIALEGDRRQMFRMLRVFKNRFGPNEDLLVFQMKKNGLEVIEDPSTFFLEARDPELSGAALVMGVDGQKPFVVEVQALVTRSFLPVPRRTALGFDVNRLNLLLAVLEKRLKLNFSQVDIYAKVGGGIRLHEPGLDLALVAAVLSSYYDVALPEKAIFWGEIDLNGQIRPVAGHAKRLSQAARLGFSPVFAPADSDQDGLVNINALQKKLFRKTGG